MRDVVLVSGVRTPVGRYLGALREVEAYDLAARVLDEAVRRAGIEPAQVDEVVLGQAYQNGEYVNIARMALLKAGWPESIPGITLDRRCCTGLDVVRYGALLIRSGAARVVVAGGVESMSNAEFYLPGHIKWGVGGREGMPRGHGDLSIWGLPFYDRIQRARVMSQPQERYGVLPSMMSWAEVAARQEGISRNDCDAWAVESHRKACAAWAEGRFRAELVPVEVRAPKGPPVVVDRDETPREDTTVEKLARLKPVLGGVCTAGNSSSENDGAAAVVLMDSRTALEWGLRPMARVLACAVAACDPRRTYEAVPTAVNRALDQVGLHLEAMDLIEVQEAFAAQVLADLKQMGIGPERYDRVNVNGSGISLGHPIACTGVRVLVTLCHEMRRRGVRYGLEAICGGGGLGIAAVFENLENPEE
ncbi:acetyl-CoA C-acetyltransferase [Desulfacinum hydrothermale DSM 13146]|uniref:Acetyl-CoA C-acetyltransferase n=1 Tax=Desulfacinum hydrothermale DSM 13146 TaxID=1121390 RepID=A0A1W1X1B0_9BACT|nr:acetyl-CoA C-acyltransferase [Desulfacinum hydrothermale]SMC17181.1 acetyl-CoA C-acetyltransferase [Desulfacinum hydrothermale DSM 13146]